MAGIGHNSGRVDEPGRSWRTHVWRKARRDLMPTLPIEVVRRRVKRAAELGLPYKTYAGIRAASGHDLIGFMFSSNALRVLREGQKVPDDRAALIAVLQDCKRIGLVHRPVALANVVPPMDQAFAAPLFVCSWSQMRGQLGDVVRSIATPADRFVLIGDTAGERAWSEALRTAGYLASDDYFAGARWVETHPTPLAPV